MDGPTLLLFKLTLLIGRSSAAHCDRATTAQAQEGNLGQSGDFKWLGVLKVHLHEWDKLRIATSGIVLIRMTYALANADDVVRIPPNIFKTNSQAMFLASRNTPWYAKPASYVAHPEYESSTLNTIAVVELKLDDTDDFPLTPICLPTPDTFSASRYLYLMGFTDDNQILEKLIYKIQYVHNTVCEEFYNRTVLLPATSYADPVAYASDNGVVKIEDLKRLMSNSKSSGTGKQRDARDDSRRSRSLIFVPPVQLTPSAYMCGYAPNSMTQCVWENGMVLVSNATGSYDLIGFGIYGPGCAAPARFIDLFPYFSWINSVTSSDEGYGDGFKRTEEDNKFIPNVPIQELYTKEGSRRYFDVLRPYDFERYPFDVDDLKFHLIEPSFGDDYTLLIIPFKDSWQKSACSKPAILMYKEYFELRAVSGIQGTAIYKLSLYDKAHATCSCVRLTIDCRERSDVVLSFKEVINLKENTEFTENLYQTPEEILKYFPINERTEKPKTKLEFDADKLLIEPGFIKDDDMFPRRVMNYDLYIKFEFTARAIMEFEMFAEPFNHSIGWLLPTTNRKRTEPRTTKSETSNTTKTNTRSDHDLQISKHNNTEFKKKKRPKSHWGMGNWADKMLKEAQVNVVANVEEVQETESAARSEGEPGAVVMVCWLVSACLRRAFFVY